MKYLLTLLVTLTIMGLIQSAKAQQHSHEHAQGHDQNHHWYNGLKQPGTGYSCCNEKDCARVRARQTDEGWEVLIEVAGDRRWVPVPSHVILPDRLNLEPLSSHACYTPSGYIYCFLRGGLGG